MINDTLPFVARLPLMPVAFSHRSFLLYALVLFQTQALRVLIPQHWFLPENIKVRKCNTCRTSKVGWLVLWLPVVSYRKEFYFMTMRILSLTCSSTVIRWVLTSDHLRHSNKNQSVEIEVFYQKLCQYIIITNFKYTTGTSIPRPII